MTPEIGFDETQLALREAVAAFCRERLEKTPPGELAPFDRGEWRELAGLGVLGLPDPAGEGGALELVAAAEALGAHLHPGPLVETTFAATVLGPPLREAVVSGEMVVSAGVAPLFPYGPVADLLLEWDPATDEVHRVEAPEPLEPVAVLGDEPFGRGAVRRVEALGSARRGRPPADLVLGALMASAAGALVERAAAWARTREQFGRPIGSFQAVSHPLADASIRLLAATSLVRAAAADLDAGAARAERRAAAARRCAAAAATRACAICHQVFGALGVTLEGGVFRVTRRVGQLASRALGDAAGEAALLAELGGREGGGP